MYKEELVKEARQRNVLSKKWLGVDVNKATKSNLERAIANHKRRIRRAQIAALGGVGVAAVSLSAAALIRKYKADKLQQARLGMTDALYRENEGGMK